MISLNQARRLALQAQWLDSGREASSSALSTIEHLGYVQIDTISVIERAHHHVLWSRQPEYRPEQLTLLQQKRQVFEYWSHAASYLPMRDFRYALPRMRAHISGARHWFKRDQKIMKYVLERITSEGPLQSRDFEAPAGRRPGPWFEWKPAKKALEQLFMEGKLMINGRTGFQKIYDLTERVLPPGTDTSCPTPEELATFLARTAIRSHGLVTEAEIRYLRRGLEKPLKKTLRALTESGEIVLVRVQGLKGMDFYASPEVLEESAIDPGDHSAPVRILSPFDNVVIQRRRLKNLFGFDYQIECYVPAPKRRYGYFSLPLLQGERFIGRLDAKADRKAEVLLVQSLHLEPRVRRSDELRLAIRQALDEFARFNRCQSVRFRSSRSTRPVLNGGNNVHFVRGEV